MRGCFVTGTDTEVGKTRVSAGLLRRAAQAGLRVAGYKPVSAGMEWVDGHWVNDDVQTLLAASNIPLQPHEVGPCQLQEPCAPHLAARSAGVSIDRTTLLLGAQQLSQRADFIVAEGAGGLCVPLGPDWDSSHLMVALGLPVVLVVGLRLGCINHALLTAEALQKRRLRLVGWVGNTVDPDMLHLEGNIDTLRHEFQERFDASCLGIVPRLPAATGEAVAPYLDAVALQSLFGSNTLSTSV
jgi:dethiobiotin synthetase